MPHVIVKLYPGKTEEQKVEMTVRLTAAITSVLGCGDGSVSVSMEEVAPADWKATVYDPEIQNGKGKLYKKPGYTM